MALGKLGGKARANSLIQVERSAIAKRAAAARNLKLSAAERGRIANLEVQARERKRRLKGKENWRRRKRQQSCSIFNARGSWYVRYFEDRVIDGQLRRNRIAKQIDPVTTRGKRPVQKIEDEAREIVAAAIVTNATRTEFQILKSLLSAYTSRTSNSSSALQP